MIFKFEKSDVTRYIEHELKTLDKFREPLQYVINNLERLGHSLTIQSLDKKFDLNKVKEREGKNYHWSVFKYQNATLVVRRYRHHLTIFTKVDKKGVDYMDRPKVDYGAFTLNTDFEKFGDAHDEMMDEYYDKPFKDLNVIVKGLFELLLSRDYGVHWVWNSVSLKRPDHVDIKLAFVGKEDGGINSVDNFIFCMEELENVFQELFAENTMIQKLKELKTGDQLNKRYKIGSITTKVKNGYYHDVGMEIIDGKDKSFKDVYCLTRYYYEDVFKEKIYMYKGDIYIQGGKFEVGQPVAYKKIDDAMTIFKSSMPKENFIPLKRYFFF